MAKGEGKSKRQAWKRQELKPCKDVIINHGEALENDIVIP
jgi:hypothetical protein